MLTGRVASYRRPDFEMEINLEKREGIFHLKMWKSQKFQKFKWKSIKTT